LIEAVLVIAQDALPSDPIQGFKAASYLLKARFRRCANAVVAAAYNSTPRNTALARLELGL
jgi:hypothetical protein